MNFQNQLQSRKDVTVHGFKGSRWIAGSGIAAEPAPGATTTGPAKATMPAGHFQGHWVSKTSRFSIDLDVVWQAFKAGLLDGGFKKHVAVPPRAGSATSSGT